MRQIKFGGMVKVGVFEKEAGGFVIRHGLKSVF